ncbi:hypothetical protein GCM10027592_46800 [Spirosoma flavus]
MIDIYINQLKKLEERLDNLYTEWRNAGVDTSDLIKNKIDSTMSKIEEIQALISSIENAKMPNEIKIFCFVIVTTKDGVKKEISKSLFKLINKDRYDETNINKWKPFIDENSINTMLIEFSEKHGFKFITLYLDGTLSNEQCVEIDLNIKNSFAIIDLLSLNSDNALITQRLDTKDVKGTIFPYCESLPFQAKRIMNVRRKKYFITNEYYSQSTPMGLYAYDISAKDGFFKHLLEIFYKHFKVKNSIILDNKIQSSIPRIL